MAPSLPNNEIGSEVVWSTTGLAMLIYNTELSFTSTSPSPEEAMADIMPIPISVRSTEPIIKPRQEAKKNLKNCFMLLDGNCKYKTIECPLVSLP